MDNQKLTSPAMHQRLLPLPSQKILRPPKCYLRLMPNEIILELTTYLTPHDLWYLMQSFNNEPAVNNLLKPKLIHYISIEFGDCHLAWAAKHHHNSLLVEFVQQCDDIDSLANDGHNALHWASIRGNSQGVSILLSMGADGGSLSDCGHQALHYATENGHQNVVRLLLEHGVLVNTVDGSGWGALHLAAGNDDLRIMEMLLAFGAAVDLPSESGRETPLMCAVSAGTIRASRMLLERGAAVNPPHSHSPTSILHILIGYPWASGFNHVFHCRLNIRMPPETCITPLYNLLRSYGATIDGYLMYNAIDFTCEVMFQNLVQEPGLVNIQSTYTRSPLHRAAEKGNLIFFIHLVAFGADIGVMDEYGRTPINVAPRTSEWVEYIQALPEV